MRLAQAILAEIGDTTLFGVRTWGAIMRLAVYWDETAVQAYRITMGSLPVVVLVAMFVGANAVIQGYLVLKMVGAEAMVGTFAALAMVREMSPVLCGAMVSAKAGSAIASELATMRIRSQIDAIEVMGIDPVAYLVAPRILGSLFALPVLTIVSLYASIGMGYGVAVYQFGLNGPSFLDQIAVTTTMHDLATAILKAVAFAASLAIVQCYAGFHAQHGPMGVGMATNRAVVVGAVLIGWLNLVVSALMY